MFGRAIAGTEEGKKQGREKERKKGTGPTVGWASGAVREKEAACGVGEKVKPRRAVGELGHAGDAKRR